MYAVLPSYKFNGHHLATINVLKNHSPAISSEGLDYEKPRTPVVKLHGGISCTKYAIHSHG